MLIKYDRSDLVPQYDNLDPGWNNRKDGRFEDDYKEVRFRDFTDRLARRDESRIVVVSHGNVLEEILGEHAPEENAEVKVYSLCGGQWTYVGLEANFVNESLVSGANPLGRACLAFVILVLGAPAFRSHA